MQWKDVPLIVVAGYVVYKIGFVDGFTTINLFILLCLIVAVVFTTVTKKGNPTYPNSRNTGEAELGKDKKGS